MGTPRERGGTLDALLRDRGYTVYSLAKRSGLSEKTIRKLCNAEGPVRMNTVRRIAEHLDVSPGDLIAILQGDGIVVAGAAE